MITRAWCRKLQVWIRGITSLIPPVVTIWGVGRGGVPPGATAFNLGFLKVEMLFFNGNVRPMVIRASRVRH